MVEDGGEGDAPELKGGMAAGVLLVLGFAKGPTKGLEGCSELNRVCLPCYI